jgi:hypothetical protein
VKSNWIKVSRSIIAVLALYVGSFSSVAASQSVFLAWDAADATESIGYIVHFGQLGQAEANSIDVGSITATTISGLVEGLNYSFYVTSYTSDGLESEPSESITYSVPALRPANLLSISALANGAIRIKVNGTPGRTYVVQYAEFATPNNWTDLGAVTASSAGSAAIEDTSGVPLRMFRSVYSDF